MSYWDSEYRNRRFETTYDPNSPLEQYRRENRDRINVAMWDIDNRGTLPPVLSCPDHPGVPLVPKKSDSGSMICRECGEWKLDRLQPPKPTVKKESKVKQKQTSQTKSFISTLPEHKKKGGKLGNEDLSSNLSNDEYDWIRNMWDGNIVDGSESGG